MSMEFDENSPRPGESTGKRVYMFGLSKINSDLTVIHNKMMLSCPIVVDCFKELSVAYNMAIDNLHSMQTLACCCQNISSDEIVQFRSKLYVHGVSVDGLISICLDFVNALAKHVEGCSWSTIFDGMTVCDLVVSDPCIPDVDKKIFINALALYPLRRKGESVILEPIFYGIHGNILNSFRSSYLELRAVGFLIKSILSSYEISARPKLY